MQHSPPTLIYVLHHFSDNSLILRISLFLCSSFLLIISVPFIIKSYFIDSTLYPIFSDTPKSFLSLLVSFFTDTFKKKLLSITVPSFSSLLNSLWSGVCLIKFTEMVVVKIHKNILTTEVVRNF